MINQQSKILFINPNKWGRGFTPIWIASHTGILKRSDHDVKLFDCTFYTRWTDNENLSNTSNKQFKQSHYNNVIEWNDSNVIDDLQVLVDKYKPDIIFWSAISSHIHGEGEYTSIQYGDELLRKITTSAFKVAGGLQATADPANTLKRFSSIDLLIMGESEFVLREIANNIGSDRVFRIKGTAYLNGANLVTNVKQDIIDNLDDLMPYDYSLFSFQNFLRPYNGEIIRAADYELSRGCIYACSYCVETVIQKYYGLNSSNSKGTLKKPKQYLRSKSAKMIYKEMTELFNQHGVQLFRVQDTNFLTNNKQMLIELSEYVSDSNIDIILYIETRPEGINKQTVELLKKLNVDGVGMGVELSAQSFREGALNRFSEQKKIINAFSLLRENNIKRTAYNVIGFPGQDEESILDTIEFNKLIDPDNITVAYYSPYIGTSMHLKSVKMKYFNEYEYDLDSQIRSQSSSKMVSHQKLKYYKENFIKLVRATENSS